jgi:hypothetical protein
MAAEVTAEAEAAEAVEPGPGNGNRAERGAFGRPVRVGGRVGGMRKRMIA